MSDVSQALVNLLKARLRRKTFSTGSKGFFGQDKITVDDGQYQAQVQAVLVDSKHNPKARVQASVEEISTALAGLIQQSLQAKTFSSGKKGYRAHGRVEAHGQPFQVQVQAVRLA